MAALRAPGGREYLLALAIMGAPVSPAVASTLDGPGRFCGYSPIIDVLPGERVTVLAGGIHSGRFRWSGAFGSLEVDGLGWAGRPPGRMVRDVSSRHPAMFAPRRVGGIHQIAIWNGREGAAYFRSRRPFTPRQRAAIERVKLFQEGEEPSGCTLRTVWSWE